MTFKAQSTLEEYAKLYWLRERDKRNPEGIQIFAAVERGEDPVRHLNEKHSYKLPGDLSAHVHIVIFTNRNDIENLLVHDYMPNDAWMSERGLMPQPFTQRLGTLASICLERGYFASGRRERPIQNYHEWKSRGTLKNAIVERPLVEATDDGQDMIIDGWGRLLPFAALLLQGIPFEPIEAFRASPGRDCSS